MAEYLPPPPPPPSSDDFDAEPLPAPPLEAGQSSKLQRHSDDAHALSSSSSSSKLGSGGGGTFDKLSLIARSEVRTRPGPHPSVTQRCLQGDAVLSYRDGQSIVDVTVRSMDAKQ